MYNIMSGSTAHGISKLDSKSNSKSNSKSKGTASYIVVPEYFECRDECDCVCHMLSFGTCDVCYKHFLSKQRKIRTQELHKCRVQELKNYRVSEQNKLRVQELKNHRAEDSIKKYEVSKNINSGPRNNYETYVPYEHTL